MANWNNRILQILEVGGANYFYGVSDDAVVLDVSADWDIGTLAMSPKVARHLATAILEALE